MIQSTKTFDDFGSLTTPFPFPFSQIGNERPSVTSRTWQPKLKSPIDFMYLWGAVLLRDAPLSPIARPVLSTGVFPPYYLWGEGGAAQPNFSFRLDRNKLRQVRRREGRYLLRTNLCGRDPADLWQFYIQLTEVEAAFKNLKYDLQLRPVHHQLERRIEAHIFVAFIAYCLHITLRARLKPLAPGLTSRAVLDKFAAIQMLDVHFPTTDGRTLILSRYTEPTVEQRILVEQLELTLPPQPPPRITAAGQLAQGGKQAHL